MYFPNNLGIREENLKRTISNYLENNHSKIYTHIHNLTRVKFKGNFGEKKIMKDFHNDNK